MEDKTGIFLHGAQILPLPTTLRRSNSGKMTSSVVEMVGTESGKSPKRERVDRVERSVPDAFEKAPILDVSCF